MRSIPRDGVAGFHRPGVVDAPSQTTVDAHGAFAKARVFARRVGFAGLVEHHSVSGVRQWYNQHELQASTGHGRRGWNRARVGLQ